MPFCTVSNYNLELVHVQSEDNYADLMTKNVSKEILYKLFVSGIQVGVIETKRENVADVRTRSRRSCSI